MRDFLVAVGLVFVIEGLMLAAFPGFVMARLSDLAKLGEGRMRIIGLASAIVGVGLVWAFRRWIAPAGTMP